SPDQAREHDRLDTVAGADVDDHIARLRRVVPYESARGPLRETLGRPFVDREDDPPAVSTERDTPSSKHHGRLTPCAPHLERLRREDHRRARDGYQADQPPSTTRFAPVTYEDASDARNTTTPTYSRASARRLSGTRAEYASTNSAAWSLATPPRVIVFTRTP